VRRLVAVSAGPVIPGHAVGLTGVDLSRSLPQDAADDDQVRPAQLGHVRGTLR
jgi:hypothetical protein